MEEGKLYELISRYLAGEITPEEEGDLNAWTEKSEDNRETLEQYQQLWEMTETPELPFQPNPERAWENILPQLDEEESTGSGNPVIRRLPFWSRAAAILLIVSLAYVLVQQWNGSDDTGWVVHATGDQQLELLLPDQTQITLNANSHLRYLKDFDTRQVKLEGEAFFDVAHDENKPFTILTGETQTTVLGTAFNLRAYPGEQTVELTMERGKVEFTRIDQPEENVVLESEERAVFSKPQQEIRKLTTSTDNAFSWKEHALYFNDTPLAEIIIDLERYFYVDIELSSEELGNCVFTGDYQQPNLEHIIIGLEIALGLEVQREAELIVFSGDGCIITDTSSF